MDPEACWKELSELLVSLRRDDDTTRVEELADAMLNWLHNYGYPPKITGNAAFDRYVVRATCEKILSQ